MPLWLRTFGVSYCEPISRCFLSGDGRGGCERKSRLECVHNGHSGYSRNEREKARRGEMVGKEGMEY